MEGKHKIFPRVFVGPTMDQSFLQKETEEEMHRRKRKRKYYGKQEMKCTYCVIFSFIYLSVSFYSWIFTWKTKRKEKKNCSRKVAVALLTQFCSAFLPHFLKISRETQSKQFFLCLYNKVLQIFSRKQRQTRCSFIFLLDIVLYNAPSWLSVVC